MIRDRAQNGIQCSDAKVFVGGNSKALVCGFVRFQHDVAAFLMDHAIAPLTAKGLADLGVQENEIFAGKVAPRLWFLVI